MSLIRICVFNIAVDNPGPNTRVSSLFYNVSDVHKDEHMGRPSDLMVIQCNASNAFGYAWASAYLNVLCAYWSCSHLVRNYS